jgi:hypothetical protein
MSQLYIYRCFPGKFLVGLCFTILSLCPCTHLATSEPVDSSWSLIWHYRGVTSVVVTSHILVVTTQVLSALQWHHIMQSWYDGNGFNVHRSVHCDNILVYNFNWMHESHSLFYLTTALHVSGVTVTHLQEHKTSVTTASGNRYTVLLSAGIMEEVELFHDSSRQQYGVTVTRCCSYSSFMFLKMSDSDARNM